MVKLTQETGVMTIKVYLSIEVLIKTLGHNVDIICVPVLYLAILVHSSFGLYGSTGMIHQIKLHYKKKHKIID